MAEKPRNILVKLCYDGTNYYGWNVQPNLPTIQGELINAVKRITDENVKIKGASRTDRGVHALGQFANFFTSSDIPAEKFKDALNSVLPPDIRVLESSEVPLKFDARWSAKEKIYRYIIYQGDLLPFIKNYALCIKRRLDVARMKDAASLFEGEKDFRNFTPEKGFTKRSITRSELKANGNIVVYEIRGKSFLRYMVRNIVGALLLIGLGKMEPDELKDFIDNPETCTKRYPKFTAPPHGLYLVNVIY